MIIFRYFAKEIFATLSTLIVILLCIFMSNQFIRYLSRAASGQIPGMIIVKLMLLELPNLIGLLLPLGFYMAIILAYGKLCVDNEMTVLQACGYGYNQLLKHTLIMSMIVVTLVTIIMLWVSPLISLERAKLLHTAGVQTLIQMVMPGKFQSLANGKKIFYVESINREHTTAKNLFYAQQEIKNNQLQWKIVWAQNAFVQADHNNGENYLILQHGKAYEGVSGLANYQIAKFAQYKARLSHPTVEINNDIHILKTKDLLPIFNKDSNKAAELQWRLSIPIMTIALTLVAVPLSKINPRTGRFAKILPAIIIYFLYANFLFVARNWLVTDKIPQWLGLWWLHIIVVVLGIILIFYNRAKLS